MQSAWISSTFQGFLDKDGNYVDVEKTEEEFPFMKFSMLMIMRDATMNYSVRMC